MVIGLYLGHAAPMGGKPGIVLFSNNRAYQ